MVNDGANDYFYLHDHLYSTVALVNSAGAVVERYEYDAYGKVSILSPNYELRTTTSVANPYLFAGYRFDANTGLYHTLYRSYDPYTGRWLQHDPLGYIDSMSLYEYVMSNPMGYTDPWGMFSSAYESEFSAWDRWRYEHGFIGDRFGYLSPYQAARMDKFYPQHQNLSENPDYHNYGIVIEIKGVYNTCCKEKPFLNTSKEMGTIWADSVTFGYFDYWHDPAEQYRQDAIQRGDVMTQVGHGLSQFSATTTQAAAMALGLQAGLGATGATTSLETLLANHPALALRLQALGIMTGVGTAGMEINNAQKAFGQGDIAGGVSSSCNAGFTILLICLPVKNGNSGGIGDDFSRIDAKTWNEFQSQTKGMFASRAEAGQAWNAYKQANGIITGSARSSAQRAAFLKQLAESGKAPKWMNQWLAQGKTPPGYSVDHIVPLSIGGPDIPSNMRLLDNNFHYEIHHVLYTPWRD